MANLKIIWLCQGGFLFDNGEIRIVVDPYLSNSLYSSGLDRMTAVPVPFEMLKPDVVIFTHDHADHYNAESVAEIVKLYPNCKFAGPTSTFNHFKNDGYDTSKFSVLDVGGKFKYKTFFADAVVAHHSDKLAIGLLMEFGGKFMYLSGDTLYQSDLKNEILKVAGGRKIDIAFVCINGKWGNMSDEEAVKLMSEIMPIRAVPMHYGLFAKNTADPKNFVKKNREIGIKCDEMIAGRLTEF